jgi:hypothetical protein
MTPLIPLADHPGFGSYLSKEVSITGAGGSQRLASPFPCNSISKVNASSVVISCDPDVSSAYTPQHPER